jgi:putative nucleotidyltransferase with HDIG domain
MQFESAKVNVAGILHRRIDLPSVPFVIQRLHTLISNEDTSSHQIAEVVETDQAFTARILKLVNSPFYGFARQIRSVEEAVTILGLNAVHQLLLATSVLQNLGSGSHVLNAHDFWRHSFGVGALARRLFKNEDSDAQGEALSSGLLHDIGRLLLLKTDPRRFSAFLVDGATAYDTGREKEFFGTDHQEIGALLAEKWRFPDGVTAAIRHHHAPVKANDHKRLVATIHVADTVCHAMQIGDSGRPYVTEFSPEAWNFLGINMSDLEAALRLALDDVEEAQRAILESR